MALRTTTWGVSVTATCEDAALLTFDLLGVCSTSIMRVNLLCRGRLVERDEAVEQIVASGVVVFTPSVVWEEVFQW